MEFYEMQALIENKWRKDKENWEQARVVGYITAQSQSSKRIDPKKIIPLPWDRIETEEKEEASQEEKEAVFNEMKAWEKKMNDKENNVHIDGK